MAELTTASRPLWAGWFFYDLPAVDQSDNLAYVRNTKGGSMHIESDVELRVYPRERFYSTVVCDELDITKVLMLEQCPYHEDMFILYFSATAYELPMEGYAFFYSQSSILRFLDTLYQSRDLLRGHYRFYVNLVKTSTIPVRLAPTALAEIQLAHQQDNYLTLSAKNTLDLLVGPRH